MKQDKKVTIEDLAVMVQRGFDDVDGRIRKRIDSLEHEINKRFDRIETIILEDHRQRIDRLEDEVKLLQADFRSLVSGKR